MLKGRLHVMNIHYSITCIHTLQYNQFVIE